MVIYACVKPTSLWTFGFGGSNLPTGFFLPPTLSAFLHLIPLPFFLSNPKLTFHMLPQHSYMGKYRRLSEALSPKGSAHLSSLSLPMDHRWYSCISCQQNWRGNIQTQTSVECPAVQKASPMCWESGGCNELALTQGRSCEVRCYALQNFFQVLCSSKLFSEKLVFAVGRG